MCQLLHFNPLQNSFHIHLLILSLKLLYSTTLQNDVDNEKDFEEVRRACSKSSTFEIRAILIPCSIKYCPCSNIPGQVTTPKPPDFMNDDEDNCKITNCTKKLIITVRMTNMGLTMCKNQYIVVDHVYDPSSEHKQRLLYPYVLKIKQKPIMQTYSLIKESSVNEKSTEVVKNKNNKGYKGCKTTGEDTTCEKVIYKDKPVPYSTGFCCSCEDKELQREIAKCREEQRNLEKDLRIEESFISTIEPRKIFERGVSSDQSHIMNLLTENYQVTHQSTVGDAYDKNQLLNQEQILNTYQEAEFGSTTENISAYTKRKEDCRKKKKVDPLCDEDDFYVLDELEELLGKKENQRKNKCKKKNEISRIDNMCDQNDLSLLSEDEGGEDRNKENKKAKCVKDICVDDIDDYRKTNLSSGKEYSKSKKRIDLLCDEDDFYVLNKLEEIVDQNTNRQKKKCKKKKAKVACIDNIRDGDDLYVLPTDEECENPKKEKKRKKKKKKKKKCKKKPKNLCLDDISDEDDFCVLSKIEEYLNDIENKKKTSKKKPKHPCKENLGNICKSAIKNKCKEKSKAKFEDKYEDIIKQCEKEGMKTADPYIHIRGGQDCRNKTCPPGVDPRKYHKSTHCLIFSKLWYTVYKMQKPSIFHELSLEIYEKHEDLLGHVLWNDVTNGKPLILGTSRGEDTDDAGSVWAGYTSQDPPQHSFGLDPLTHRLLVPEPLDQRQALRYPELKAGPYEWLVVPDYMITYDGSRCDKVGVGFEAFVKQPDRCNKVRGTCLKNQPKDLWCHDHRLEEIGRIGSYFLKYYGFLPSNPLQNSTENGGRNLTMYFRSPFFNTLNIELKTEYNVVLRPSAAAVITEVYIDSTNCLKSIITIKITNTGLVYGVFYAAITDCPLDMPASFNNIQTRSAVIPPQHQHIFVIEIMCSLPDRRFYCSVEAKNIKTELLAFRRIRFQKNDRCICIWHCSCACLDTDGGLKCHPLSFDHYNAAGFHGGLPFAADYVQFTLIEELMTLMYHLFLTMTLVLIIMGVMKGIIGFFYKPIGEWGLCSMLGLPKPMKSYHEKSLRSREVQYDLRGWPIHPDTKRRVRNASMVVEFCINVIFFLIYPLVMINVIVRKMCFVEATNESDRPPCCLCGQKHETGECPSLGILKGLGFYRRNDTKECPVYHRMNCMDAGVQYSSRESVMCSCHLYK